MSICFHQLKLVAKTDRLKSGPVAFDCGIRSIRSIQWRRMKRAHPNSRRFVFLCSCIVSALIPGVRIASTQVCYAYGIGMSHVRVSDGLIQIYPGFRLSPGVHRFDAIGNFGFQRPQLVVTGAQRRVYVPSWVLFCMSIGIAIVSRLAAKTFPKTCCAACGYDLTGNVSGRCPECGEEIARSAMGPD